MRKLRFNLSFLLVSTAIVVVMTYVAMQVHDFSTVLDFTYGKSQNCEIHGTKMAKQLVSMNHGMPRFDEEWNVEFNARTRLFPHADEAYNTGYCCPTAQELARVYVCPQCSKAKASWLLQLVANEGASGN